MEQGTKFSVKRRFKKIDFPEKEIIFTVNVNFFLTSSFVTEIGL